MPISIHAKFYEHDWLWFGTYSAAHSDGPMYSFLAKYAPDSMNLKVYRSDGITVVPEHPICRHQLSEVDSTAAVAALCTRGVSDPRIILMPLDDESFLKGVYETIASRCVGIPWEERRPIAFWRGTMSGGSYPTIRSNVVWDLYQFPRADVKFVRVPGMPSTRTGMLCYQEDNRFFDDNRSLKDHLDHKYILILDGNCIASAHQWVFASGSVPIMVTHPENDWWFRKYLTPMVHYVPVNHDLSDLKEKIDWLIANDDKAKRIAENAVEFSKTVLSSEFQQGYLLKEINRVAALSL